MRRLLDAIRPSERRTGITVARQASALLLTALVCAPVTPRAGAQATSSRPASRPPVRTPDIFFVPTRQVVADAMLRLARVGPDDIVYDLGSGDGRIVILAAQKYGARGVGIELVPRLVQTSREVAIEGEVADKATFIEGDFFSADISAATVVTLYLSPSVNRRLLPKLQRELKPGTRIVSHQFRVGSWMPDQIVRADDGTNLFLYMMPPRGPR